MYRSVLSILTISLIGVTVVYSTEVEKSGLPPLRNVPTISEIRKPIPEDRPIKVAATAFMHGSTGKNLIDIAIGLSKERDSEGRPVYNVTLIV